LDCSAQVIFLAATVVVLALASTRAPKVESKHRKSCILKRPSDSIDDLVVHRPAEQRMRVANYGCPRHPSSRFFEYRLDSTGRPWKESVAG
jgi:hypothetical protein